MIDTRLPGAAPPSCGPGIPRPWLRMWSCLTVQPTDDRTLDRGASTATSCGAVRVLVVDDSPVNRMVVAAQLESPGLAPFQASDGSEAVALACDLTFDLILMDLQMPVLDGLAATSAIRHFEHIIDRPAVPVVAYSSTCPAAGVLARFGMNGSLGKPCADEELEHCLRQWCPTYRSARGARHVACDDSLRWTHLQKPDTGRTALR